MSKPLILESFAESIDDHSLLDISKDLLFLRTIEEFLLTCKVTLGTMTVFAILELLRTCY